MLYVWLQDQAEDLVVPNAYGSLLQAEVSSPYLCHAPQRSLAVFVLMCRRDVCRLRASIPAGILVHTTRGRAVCGLPTWHCRPMLHLLRKVRMSSLPPPVAITTILEQDLFYSSYTLSVFHNTDKFLSSDEDTKPPGLSAKRCPQWLVRCTGRVELDERPAVSFHLRGWPGGILMGCHFCCGSHDPTLSGSFLCLPAHKHVPSGQCLCAACAAAAAAAVL
jgi:hypothetical protein